MLKSYKTEIDPSLEQIVKINQTLGVCRFIYNMFISENIKAHKEGKKYINNYEFSKWLNNEFIPNNLEYKWIKEVSSKSVRNSIDNANVAFINYFNSLKKPKKKLTDKQKKKLEKKKRKGIINNFPKFKKKNKNESSMYFVKNNLNDCICERHRIKIPTLGWVKLKEKGYIPTDLIIKHGNITKKAGRYYLSVTVETQNNNHKFNEFDKGIGIDLGIKDLAICSNTITYKNINKTEKVRKSEKTLKREMRSLLRKIEDNKKRKEKSTKNIAKNILRIQKLNQRLDNIRTDYINKVIDKIVKAKPSYITIEDLNISGMMNNKYLSKAVASQKLYEFRSKLTNRCKEYGIELRIVDRFYASSKTCHNCGNIKKDLLLSDRTYVCKKCGMILDRDYNASLNLRDAKEYRLI